MGTQSLNSDGNVEDVWERYFKLLYGLAYARTRNRADAEDVLQEVFMRYLKSGTIFNSEQHRKAWLIKTAINCSKTLLTSAWFRKTTSLRETLITPDKERSEVFYAVMDLPVKYRILVHLYYYEDLPVAEIGELLNMKEATVKTRLHRARRLLRTKLKGAYEDV